MIIIIKMLLSFFALGSLGTVKRYLTLYQLGGYEYPLLIMLGTLSMFLAVSSNNWIILFLSLELQALCFLVLFAWNRRSERAINATLKFAVVNFIASTLILVAFIEIILYTQTFNISLSNPFSLLHSFLTNPFLIDPFISWGEKYGISLLHYQYSSSILGFPHLSETVVAFSYNSALQFTGFLIVLGFAMKLGLVPFGFWLQDLYTSVSLPVLTFFSTAPKLTYLTILLSLYINLYGVVDPKAFLNPFLCLGVVTIVIGNLLMFAVRNNLLKLLAWSSVANMGLLFFLFGKYPLSSYTLVFMLYYTVSTFLFFMLLQNFVLMDGTGSLRHPMYFSDLSIVRHQPMLRLVFMVFALSFLNFFGIPPFLNFWMKYTVLQGVIYNTAGFGQWALLVSLVLMTIIGGFAYIRILYTLLTENRYLGLYSVYYPNTSQSVVFIALNFFLFQLLVFFGHNHFVAIFQACKLLGLLYIFE